MTKNKNIQNEFEKKYEELNREQNKKLKVINIIIFRDLIQTLYYQK